MAKPMTPEQWLAALRAEGVTDIVEMPGWRSNNRNHIKAFSDVHATMVHHTAGEGPGLPSLVFNGTGDLPGPLCHDYLTRTGRLYLVGNGRANHAGTVARNAYDAVLNERPVHPYPDAAEPLDGNSLSYGLECENNGAEGRAWPAVQYDVAVRVQAVRCRFHGWSANSVWAHKEATRRKPVDPRLDMDNFRADVAERLKHPAGWNPGDADTPEEDDEMKLNDQVPVGNWVKDQWPSDKGLQDGRVLVQTALGSGYAHSRRAAENTTAILAQLGAQQATIDKLVDAIGSGDGLTAAEIKAAAEAGAQAALDRLGDALKEN